MQHELKVREINHKKELSDSSFFQSVTVRQGMVQKTLLTFLYPVLTKHIFFI